MSEAHRDIVFAAIAFGIAVAVAITALGYPIGSSYFPLTLAVFIAVLSATFGVRIWLGRQGSPAAARPPWHAAATAFAAIIAYVFVMMAAGYEISTFLFLTLLIGYLGGGHWLRAGAIAALTTAALWGIFFALLEIPRPDSPFF